MATGFNIGVFECIVDEKLFHEMREGIDNLIDLKEDSVRTYVLCKDCEKSVEISGLGDLTKDCDIYIV